MLFMLYISKNYVNYVSTTIKVTYRLNQTSYPFWLHNFRPHFIFQVFNRDFSFHKTTIGKWQHTKVNSGNECILNFVDLSKDSRTGTEKYIDVYKRCIEYSLTFQRQNIVLAIVLAPVLAPVGRRPLATIERGKESNCQLFAGIVLIEIEMSFDKNFDEVELFSCAVLLFAHTNRNINGWEKLIWKIWLHHLSVNSTSFWSKQRWYLLLSFSIGEIFSTNFVL